MNWQIACNASIPWVLELPASHQGIAKRTARYIPWDWALACRRHCFNAWPHMDMEQRTSLLMDWFFLGREDFLRSKFALKMWPYFVIFFHVFQLILNFLLNFCMMKEIIVFLGRPIQKNFLYMKTCFFQRKIMFVIFHTPTYQLRILGETGLRFESKWREGKICLKLWFTRQEKKKPCRSLVMLHLVLLSCNLWYICSY